MNRIVKFSVFIILLMNYGMKSSQDFNSIDQINESIENSEARRLFTEAMDYHYRKIDYKSAIILFNKADSIEPKNPIIIGERGSIKFTSKHDIEGAFIDFEKAIEYSQGEKNRQMRYNNRGISFMQLGDIESACSDWKKSGSQGEYYLKQYCDNRLETILRTNNDEKLQLELKLLKDEIVILSPHNSPEMSYCPANILIRNLGYSSLTLVKSNLDYGLETDGSTLYLEAINSVGKKFHFFTKSTYSTYSSQNDSILTTGNTYAIERNITHLHQFCYPGTYKVRMVLRPTKNIKGLKGKYYSNWETLTVVRK